MQFFPPLEWNFLISATSRTVSTLSRPGPISDDESTAIASRQRRNLSSATPAPSNHLLCEVQEQLVHVLVEFCRRDKVLRTNAPCVRLCLLWRHDALAFQVGLVPGDRDVDPIADDLSQLFHPVLDAVEAVAVGDVIYKKGSVGISVIDRSESVKPLLSCRVLFGGCFLFLFV